MIDCVNGDEEIFRYAVIVVHLVDTTFVEGVEDEREPDTNDKDYVQEPLEEDSKAAGSTGVTTKEAGAEHAGIIEKKLNCVQTKLT